MGVPVMAVTIVVVPRLIPESKADVPAPLDLTSAALSVFSVLSLVFALKRAVEHRLRLPRAGHARGRRGPRRRVPAPPGHARATRCSTSACSPGPRVRRTLAALFLTALLMGGTSLFFNLYLQEVQGLSPLGAAWWMLP